MRLSAALGPLVAVCAAACAFALPAKLPAAPDYKHLYETHEWFALRDAVNSAAEHAPIFYRGAVESAFNEAEAADRDLKMDMRGEPHSSRAPEARELLIALYYRQGKYKSALGADDLYRHQPANDDDKKERSMLAALAQAGDLAVAIPKSPASVTIDIVDGNLFLPVTINNSAASYAFDNGSSMSMMSESEAKRLGLTVQSTGSTMYTMSGASIAMRIAVVNDLAIGGMHFSHAVFGVTPDANPPFNDLPAGKRGIIGMPVLMAMKNQRWSATKRTFEFNYPVPLLTKPAPNLALEQTSTFVQVRSKQTPLQMSLDTGAQVTYLYPAFTAAFPTAVAAGKKETKTVTGVGGSSNFDSVVLDSITLTIGGHDLTLKPAHVLTKDNTPVSAWFAGNVGMDLLNQSSTTSIDWSLMTLSLE
ncbi:MAG: aspartyl protease family protein [Candidatus Acidiferrales bacterium]